MHSISLRPFLTSLSLHSQFRIKQPAATIKTWQNFTSQNPRMASLPAEGRALPSKPPAEGKTHGKRPHHNNHGHGRKPAKMRKKEKPAQEGSHEEVLLADVQALLAAQRLTNDAVPTEPKPLPEQWSEIEVDVVELSSTGDGLAKQKGSDHIYVVPFTVPGDTAKVKVYRHLPKEGYTVTDFLSVIKPSPLRDDSRIQCQYFAKCSGCQFQMLDYAEQLRHKRNIVVKAYRNFSQLPPELVPDVLETIGSPLQYGYRTKLTPHFDGPPGQSRRSPKTGFKERPPIGFTPKATRKVLDIEDCPIATDAVRKGLRDERKRLEVEFDKYTKGATILLRESTKRVPKDDTTTQPEENIPEEAEDSIKVETDSYTDYKTCITDNNATSTEYIDDFIFTNPAGSFFQNNNSILPPFTEYIRQHILPPLSSSPEKPIRTLIDAYSGSGLFTITQSSLFPGGSIGIDIAEKSIAFARRNAVLNGLRESQCRFIAADAPELFKSVAAYDPDETVVVLDPPRKGCDASFLAQLLRFAPRRVVYTGHVEGVAVLNRVKDI
ncbi:S-adenosyl-L-methionine-dependent methyltransferase [Echria macrotheca]|uniref:S-adenosyl-L-methionine-dependent methyltransferase n=1 Tax=Echria macrotheca TaxID=438768 RepID=A0AAJ0BD68_9PEZI|nr:S-adenosyl-L-methionine-dependent methyltransferase [Echria macrotheca]